jgi:hypothetical protein
MTAPHPPRLATWLAQRLVSGRRRESLVGDLMEQFRSGRSSFWYWRQVIMAVSVVELGRRITSQTVMTLVCGIVVVMVFVPSVLGGRAAVWYFFYGPPLDFDAPRDDRVVAHIDWFGRAPGDIARIRITETDTGLVLWDVQSISGHAGCWNNCWNLTLQAGENPASFSAGPQGFRAELPLEAKSFFLSRGRPYLFEVWDHKGRVVSEHFSL